MAKRLDTLLAKREAVNARIKKEQARTRSEERKNDTRRKVLAGAAVLQLAAKDNEFSQRLMAEMNTFLVREYDRTLFGLPALAKPAKPSPEEAGPS